MTQALTEKPTKPGLVIFVAILNFFSAAFFLMMSIFCVVAMLFGAAWGIDDYFTRQMSQFSTVPNFSYGLTLIFGLALFVFACFTAFFLVMAVGLLKGKKYAWYLQVVLSTVSLLSFPMGFVLNMTLLPLGSIFNIILLVFFFQSRIRGFFKV